MALVFAIIAGMVIGGGIVGYNLSRRWSNEVEGAKTDLNQMLEQHQAEVEQSKELKQRLADLEYQLNEARKDLNFYRNKDQD